MLTKPVAAKSTGKPTEAKPMIIFVCLQMVTGKPLLQRSTVNPFLGVQVVLPNSEASTAVPLDLFLRILFEFVASFELRLHSVGLVVG